MSQMKYLELFVVKRKIIVRMPKKTNIVGYHCEYIWSNIYHHISCEVIIENGIVEVNSIEVGKEQVKSIIVHRHKYKFVISEGKQ